MKKCLLFLFASVALFGISLSLMACNNHEHICSNWVTIEESTCSEEGLREGSCDICGKKMSEAIEKLPHEFGEWKITLSPSCKYEGLQERTCDVCQTVEEEKIDKLPHQPYLIQGKEPTCTEAGTSDGQKCSICGDVLLEQKELPANGHSFEEWIKIEDATCEEPGEMERRCSVCSHLETKEIAPIQHDWGPWQPSKETKGKHIRTCRNDDSHTQEKSCVYSKEKVIDASCNDRGYTLEVCSDCKDEIETNIVDPLGHKYNGWIAVTVPGGETEEGHTHKHYQECERCHEKTTEETCSFGNAVPVDATCTTPGYDKFECPLCKSVHEVITSEASGHSFDGYEVVRTSPYSQQHYQSCTKCDYTTDRVDCPLNEQITPATCTAAKRTTYSCPICEKSFSIPEGNPLNHKYSAWKFTGDGENHAHERKCERCNDIQTGNCELVEIKNLPATCTSDGSITKACKYCYESFTEKGATSLGHNWKWTEITDTHHTRYCDKCKKTEKNEHNFDVIEHISASCTQEEVFVKKCPDCEKQIRENGAPGLGHVWSVDKIFADRHERHCLNCSEVDTSAHDWSKSNLCAACEHDSLTYKIEGVHAIVTNEGKVKSPNIIIPEFHKVLDGNGGYEKNEYKVIEIAQFAFRSSFGDNIFTTTVIIPASIETIGFGAFTNCRKLQSFTIDGDTSSLKTISENAFANCGALVKFEAPESLINIGYTAFVNCTSLVEIDIKDNDNIEVIGAKAFYNTGFVNDENNWSYQDENGKTYTDALYIGKHLISARQVGDNTTFVVLEGTKSIAESAFSNFITLTKITLPTSVKIIDRNAFEKCVNIAEVEFTGTVSEWFDITFMNDLSSPLYYKSTGLHIDKAQGTINLSDKNITKIPAGTFRNTSITKIIFPSTLKEIGQFAFADCASLEEIDFNGANITNVAPNAFTNCKLYVPQDGVICIGYILVKATNDIAAEYAIKDGIRIIADEAFKDCTTITKITIGKDVENVGIDAFSGCTQMNTIEFADPTYSWLVFIKDSIGRGYTNDELTWNRLQSCNGQWIRLKKPVV